MRYTRWRSCVVVDVVADVRLMSKAYVLVLLVVSFIALQLRLHNAALVDATDVAAVSRTAAVARIRYEAVCLFTHIRIYTCCHTADSWRVGVAFNISCFRMDRETKTERERVRETELCVYSVTYACACVCASLCPNAWCIQ